MRYINRSQVVVLEFLVKCLLKKQNVEQAWDQEVKMDELAMLMPKSMPNPRHKRFEPPVDWTCRCYRNGKITSCPFISPFCPCSKEMTGQSKRNKEKAPRPG